MAIQINNTNIYILYYIILFYWGNGYLVLVNV